MGFEKKGSCVQGLLPVLKKFHCPKINFVPFKIQNIVLNIESNIFVNKWTVIDTRQ
jgi:hypothetical protein